MTHGEWGFLFRTAMLRNRFPEQCALKDPTVACPCTGRHLLKEMRTSRSSLSSGTPTIRWQALNTERKPSDSREFYLKELSGTELSGRLFEAAYGKAADAKDLWWQ